jgi:hypothetical protein
MWRTAAGERRYDTISIGSTRRRTLLPINEAGPAEDGTGRVGLAVKNIIHDITSRPELRNRTHAVADAIKAGLI